MQIILTVRNCVREYTVSKYTNKYKFPKTKLRNLKLNYQTNLSQQNTALSLS
jgi:hypothetical protein